MTGTIKTLNRDKGFGFIKADGREQREFFFHRSALRNARFDQLGEGQEVTFEEGEGEKGPRAEDVYV